MVRFWYDLCLPPWHLKYLVIKLFYLRATVNELTPISGMNEIVGRSLMKLFIHNHLIALIKKQFLLYRRGHARARVQ